MLIKELKLKNWRSFCEASVSLEDTQFVAGKGVRGISDFLDAFIFLRDLTAPHGGGLQKAVEKRGGISDIRYCGADEKSEIVIGVSFADVDAPEDSKWRYEIGIVQKNDNHQTPYLSYEKVWDGDGNLKLYRPDTVDTSDWKQRTKTHLEQDDKNQDFGKIAEHLREVSHLHSTSQIIHDSKKAQGKSPDKDPLWKEFFAEVTNTPKNVRGDLLDAISQSLRGAIPGCNGISFPQKDATNGFYINLKGGPGPWPVVDTWQNPTPQEDEESKWFFWSIQYSITLLWSLLYKGDMLLLDNPGKFLHSIIAEKIPELLHKAKAFYESKYGMQSKGQVLISTGNIELLSGKNAYAKNVLSITTGKDSNAIELVVGETD